MNKPPMMIAEFRLPDDLRRGSRLRTGLRPSSLLAVISGLVNLLASGCMHELADQPRVDTGESVEFFADHQSLRSPVQGTIARGELAEDNALETTGRGDKPVEQIPVDVSTELMRSGREQFGIFCSHCHGPAGYGDGIVVQRGFPAPPSYHTARLQSAPAGHFFQVVARGHGRMPAFSRRIPPDDRWAIVAWIRALQLSQQALLSELPAVDRTALSELTEEDTSE